MQLGQRLALPVTLGAPRVSLLVGSPWEVTFGDKQRCRLFKVTFSAKLSLCVTVDGSMHRLTARCQVLCPFVYHAGSLFFSEHVLTGIPHLSPNTF